MGWITSVPFGGHGATRPTFLSTATKTKIAKRARPFDELWLLQISDQEVRDEPRTAERLRERIPPLLLLRSLRSLWLLFRPFVAIARIDQILLAKFGLAHTFPALYAKGDCETQNKESGGETL
jgi:hypothetical protein